MSKVIKFLQKIKGNHITILDVIIVLLFFFAAKWVMDIRNPTKISVTKKNVQYLFSINDPILSADEMLISNVVLRNVTNKDVEIFTKSEVFYNIMILKGDKLVYKKDIIERNLESPKKITIKRFGKLYFSAEWPLISNTNEKITSGEYKIVGYIRDFDIKFELPFRVE